MAPQGDAAGLPRRRPRSFATCGQELTNYAAIVLPKRTQHESVIVILVFRARERKEVDQYS